MHPARSFVDAAHSFLQGLQFLFTLLHFISKKDWRTREFDEECMEWLNFLINLVDYSDPHAPECVQLLSAKDTEVFKNFSGYISARVSL